jgi:protein-arginine deiminase
MKRTRFQAIMLGSTTVLAALGCSSTPNISSLEEAAPVPSAQLVLLADVNRDGKLDGGDLEGRHEWTLQRGALFLNNNDSDPASGEPDWADDVVNGPEDLKDLAVIRIPPIAGICEAASLSLRINSEAASRVRIFLAEGTGYRSLTTGDPVNLGPAQIRTGVELRIEANQYADARWDGQVRVTADLSCAVVGDQSDHVVLRVAPFMMLSNGNPGRQLFVREYPGQNERFMEQLQAIVPAAGAELIVVPREEISGYRPNHIWLQDTMEIGYTEMPGARMNVVMKANRNKSLDAWPKDGMLGPDFGWFQQGSYRPQFGAGDGDDSWLDWYGNLEVTPPLPDWPLGRVYYGVSGPHSLNPEVVAMLDAQGVQGPSLGLDVGWLLIRHVDEMIAFVPSGNPERPWKILVPSFEEFHRLLVELNDAGHGDKPIMDRYHEYWKKSWTVGSLLADESLVSFNRRLDEERIQPMIRAALKGFGMTEEDLIGIPAMHMTNGGALLPNMVNAAVLNGHLLMSDPNGPIIDGVDPIQVRTLELLKGLPLRVHFLEDTRYHKWSGNVHCATNVTRDGFPQPWWKLVGK